MIDPNASSVLFFSDNDDCRGIENQQRHPDWEQGQENSSRNDDGTPTYGYAYNTGDSTKGEISWGFEPADLALSRGCVLTMGVSGAYETRRAVRIFRRYDRTGAALPADAYYSAWFYFPTEVAYDARATVAREHTSAPYRSVQDRANRRPSAGAGAADQQGVISPPGTTISNSSIEPRPTVSTEPLPSPLAMPIWPKRRPMRAWPVPISAGVGSVATTILLAGSTGSA